MFLVPDTTAMTQGRTAHEPVSFFKPLSLDFKSLTVGGLAGRGTCRPPAALFGVKADRFAREN